MKYNERKPFSGITVFSPLRKGERKTSTFISLENVQ